MDNIYVLSDVKDKLEGINYIGVFDIKIIKSKININNYDALIFTSKNAIISLDTFNTDYKKIPSYVIAPKTAEVLKQYEGNIIYIGQSSNGDDFANEISQKLIGKKVLYIRAKKVVSNLKNILKNKNIECNELIVYETTCKKQNIINPNKNAKIIFTSPSSMGLKGEVSSAMSENI